MNNYKYLFYLLLFLVYAPFIYSQEPIYKHFGVDEGLPSSQIYDIYQSKDGYMWFATDKGVSRYNGYEFENFDTNDGLPGNVVLRFYPQKNGEIWAYTFHSKALFYFHENFKGFVNYKYNKTLKKEFHKNTVLKSVFVNDDKTVTLGGHYINGIITVSGKGVLSRKYNSNLFFDDKTKGVFMVASNLETENFFLTINKEIALKRPSIKIVSRASSHQSLIWFHKNKKAVFRNGSKISIVDVNKQIKNLETQHIAIGLESIDSNHFFVGYYNNGGKIFNSNGKIIKTYLEDKSVTSFLKDHSGGYWFSTLNSGVYYIKKPTISVFNSPVKKETLHVNSLAKKKGALLIGYKDGSFEQIKSKKTLKFEKAKSKAYPSIVEYDAFRDKTYVFNNNNLTIDSIIYKQRAPLKFSEATKNSFVYTSNRSDFTKADSENYHMFFKRVQDVSIYKKDTLIATPFGIYQQLKDSAVNLSKQNKLLKYRSDDIDVSTNGNYFFIATHGAGVVFYGKNIFNVTTKDGLTSNIVKEIHIENDSTIWACTNKGLNRIIFKDNNFNVSAISKNDGLLSNEIEDVEIMNDTLWIGTKDGLIYMPKSTINTKKLNDIYLKIKEVNVNNIIFNTDKKLKLNYDENKITFSVEGISYANNKDLQYKYRLKEIDPKWSITKNRDISFPNLKDGSYTFQVKACLQNRCQSDKILEYHFTIKPPFWKSWWFSILCFLAFGGLFYLFFKIRVLTYNKDVVREFLRLLIKRLKREEKFLEIRMNGEDLKVPTNDILYIKSSGNYLDIICTNKKYTIRCKIGYFIALTPDPLEFLRIHRSYIIRIDKVSGKSKKSVKIKDEIIPVGETYIGELDKIHF